MVYMPADRDRCGRRASVAVAKNGIDQADRVFRRFGPKGRESGRRWIRSQQMLRRSGRTGFAATDSAPQALAEEDSKSPSLADY